MSQENEVRPQFSRTSRKRVERTSGRGGAVTAAQTPRSTLTLTLPWERETMAKQTMAKTMAKREKERGAEEKLTAEIRLVKNMIKLETLQGLRPATPSLGVED